jgi:hypothetical protein
MNLEMLDSVLDSSLGGGTEDNPEELIPLVQLPDGAIDPRYTRTSYSSSLLLHKCPRKYQLKCLMTEKKQGDETSLTFAFGSVVGYGIAELAIGTPVDEVIWNMFLQWDVDYDAENDKQRKSFPRAIFAIKMFQSLLKNGYLGEYEVATYNGKPAAELSFRVNIPGRYGVHTFRGYLDLVLRHEMSGMLAVAENKTNSGTWVNHYQYKNSAQALGYSVILDFIEGDKSAYEVLYNIYMTKLERYENFPFAKNFHMRALWIRDLLWDVDTVERLVDQEGNYGIWPMRGESCVDFGIPCEYMDVCHLETTHLMKPLRENHMTEVDREGNPVVYDFDIAVADLL